jgi:hypothetical protein
MATFKLEIFNIKQGNIHPLRKNALFVLVFLCTAVRLIAQPDSLANLPQYLYPDFTMTVVKLKTGVNITAIMNYNTLTETMTFYKDGTLLDLNKPESVDTVFMRNTKFVFVEKAFYEVLLNAPVSLFIQHKSDLTSTGRSAAYGTTSQTVGPTSISKYYGGSRTYSFKLPENFKVTPSPVYWVRMNNVMYRFLTVHQFLKIFPTEADKIKQYINQSDINITKTGDLIKLVTFCNELIR